MLQYAEVEVGPGNEGKVVVSNVVGGLKGGGLDGGLDDGLDEHGRAEIVGRRGGGG